jgi:poly-gamma-glutamate synthesis protein (capsule biosynthesis protein)
MIEALKASGVDVVELTGNHNNDVGSQYNTETINLYKSLGWGTFGGGLNNEEASKPFLSDQKGTKLALLGYNYPDSPNGGAISGLAKAGANSFDFDKIQADITAAKQTSQYVIVDIQFWECYAYPNGFVEFPECDSPITNQAEVFKKVVDLGADMVVGSSAHQPQTFELYKDKPIYYGLGNLYFEQIEWPGTERGIILTHYLNNGKLLQTKLTPTVYDNDLQTRVMTDSEAEKLLTRLDSAR